jgi:3-methyladenine DNA glycosylase AlkD
VTGRPRAATSSAEPSRAAAVLAELAAQGSEADRAGMAGYGINVDDAYGVSVAVLRRMAKGLGHDHELALELWRTGNHEARLLAAFVDEPDKVDERQMESWAADFDSWDLCDEVTTDLFDRTRFAWARAVAWAGRPEEFVKRAGFALMAGLAVHDKAAGHEAFVALLEVVEREAFDERNFVKKAVNWALRNIGKRSLDLNREAVACAQRLRDAADERAGGPRGGDAATRAARWVAADALRELRAPKTLERLSRRGA